ncbi:MAG: hypothetical protein ACI8Q1_002462 [Parvicella sp.]|jgi:hypothetical protein
MKLPTKKDILEAFKGFYMVSVYSAWFISLIWLSIKADETFGII